MKDADPELMKIWAGCGITFGNHTYSHPRLATVGLKAYLQDLRQGHDALASLLGAQPVSGIPFRHPYLREGATAKEREAILALLRELNSVPVPVTIDTSDWYFSRSYVQALAAGKKEAARREERSWAWDLQEATLHAEQLSRELFKREPPQILLLHANTINADHLEVYLRWLEKRGYRFISLGETLTDPAYREQDNSVSPTGDSLWLRLRRSRALKKSIAWPNLAP